MTTAASPKHIKQQIATATQRKPLGVRVTPEQHQILTEAARREHRSVSGFVLQAALTAAEKAAKPRQSYEEIHAILQAARAEVAVAIPEGESFLDNFLAERRRDAARE